MVTAAVALMSCLCFTNAMLKIFQQRFLKAVFFVCELSVVCVCVCELSGGGVCVRALNILVHDTWLVSVL